MEFRANNANIQYFSSYERLAVALWRHSGLNSFLMHIILNIIQPGNIILSPHISLMMR